LPDPARPGRTRFMRATCGRPTGVAPRRPPQLRVTSHVRATAGRPTGGCRLAQYPPQSRRTCTLPVDPLHENLIVRRSKPSGIGVGATIGRPTGSPIVGPTVVPIVAPFGRSPHCRPLRSVPHCRPTGVVLSPMVGVAHCVGRPIVAPSVTSRMALTSLCNFAGQYTAEFGRCPAVRSGDYFPRS